MFQSLIYLLRKINPVDLNATPSALSECLRGHGDDLVTRLSVRNKLMQQANPQFATLQGDFLNAAVVTNIYADDAPDLNTVINNVSMLDGTVINQRDNLNDTLLATIGLSNNAYETLAPTEQNLIDFVIRLLAPLKVVVDYSSEMGCLFRGISLGVQEFASLISFRKAGLFTLSSFILGSPAYTYLGEHADRQHLQRP